MSQQINLFNPIFLKQKKYFSTVTIVQALGLILLGCLLLAGYLSYQSTGLKKGAMTAAGNLAAAQTQLAQVTAAAQSRQKDKALEERIRKKEAEIASMQQVFSTLQKGDLGNTSGYAEYFRALSRQSVPGLWLTGFGLAGTGSEISIRGRSLQPDLVPEYLGRLKREESMRGKSFTGLEIREPEARPAAEGQQASGQPALAGYVEFHLHGSDAAKDKAGENGK